MIFKFRIFSDEVDDFLRTITIDSEATFLALNSAILESVNYPADQMTAFQLCDSAWEPEQEITLMEMDSSSEYDNLVMDKIKLDELLTDEKQRLLFVFDMFNNRSFYMELAHIIPNKRQEKAECIKSSGKPPKQIVELDTKISSYNDGLPEDFYGEDYDAEDLDNEGFGEMNFDDDSLF